MPTTSSIPTVRVVMIDFVRAFGIEKGTGADARCQWWMEQLGDVVATELGAELVGQCRDKLVEEGVKPSIVRRFLYELAEAFRHAGVPILFADVDAPKSKFGFVRTLTLDEQARLLRATRMSCNPHLFPMCALALEVGLMKSEVMPLRWENIDLNEAAIVVGSPKGEKRTVPVTDEAEQVLREHRRFAVGTGWLFPSMKNRKEPISSFYRSWSCACKEAGLFGLDFKMLRFTKAQALLEDGTLVAEAANLAGFKRLYGLSRRLKDGAGMNTSPQNPSSESS